MLKEVVVLYAFGSVSKRRSHLIGSGAQTFSSFLFAVCLLLVATELSALRALAESDPLSLQQQAIKRIEGYIEHFKKTGDQQSRRADLIVAEEELTASAQEFLRQSVPSAAALSIIKLGDARRLQNRADSALKTYEEGLRLAQKADDKLSQTLALIGLGRTEANLLKDYSAAGSNFEQATRSAADLPDRTHLFNALSGLGNVQVSKGDLIAAADTYNRCFVLAPGLKDQSLILYAHLDRGEIYQKFAEKCDYQRTFEPCYEHLDLAKKDYVAAQEIANKFHYAGLSSLIQNFLNELDFRRRMYEDAQRLAKTLKDRAIFNPARPNDVLVSETFLGPGSALPGGFIPMLQESGVLGVGDARSFFVRGLLQTLQGENQPALAAFSKAVDLLETDRRSLRQESSRSTFLDERINFYYAPIEILLQERRHKEAFDLMERSRSRAMTDLIFSKKLAFAQPEESAMFGRLQATSARIALQQKELFEHRLVPDTARYADQIKRSEEEIAALEGENQKILGEIATKAPRMHDLVVTERVSLADLQQSLKKDQCDVLYYLLVEQAVILWHINGSGYHVRNVFLPRSILMEKARALRGSLTREETTFDERTARELFLFLIQPALPWIESRHLVIIPHEDLNYVPFQVLCDPANGTFLGERFQISYAPNASILAHLSKSGPIRGGNLLAVGNRSLESSGREIELLRLSDLYPERHKILMDAPESQIKRLAGKYDLLHLSVHGTFNTKEPMLSYLELVKDGDDDGQLTAAEIFGLPLDKTRLVVLSACESARAEATHANEILGIQRALHYAGANSLLLSGWRVEAAAAGLWMQTFYREAQQNPLPEAARLALIEMKKKHPHPHFWAAFQMVGK